MPTYTETARIGDVLKREWEPLFNRENIVLTGGNFAVGAVVMADGNGKYKEFAKAASAAAPTDVGVVLFATDATAADKKGVMLARGPAIVAEGELVFKSGTTQAAQDAAIASLKALGIVARTTV